MTKKLILSLAIAIAVGAAVAPMPADAEVPWCYRCVEKNCLKNNNRLHPGFQTCTVKTIPIIGYKYCSVGPTCYRHVTDSA